MGREPQEHFVDFSREKETFVQPATVELTAAVNLMNFFDRPSNRKIALRGSSRTAASGAELIAAARAQRAERERHRAEVAGATVVQSVYRGRCAQRQNRRFLLSQTKSAAALAVSIFNCVPGETSCSSSIPVNDADIVRTLLAVAHDQSSARRGGAYARAKVAMALVEGAARVASDSLQQSERIFCLQKALALLRDIPSKLMEDALQNSNMFAHFGILLESQAVPTEHVSELIDLCLMSAQSPSLWILFATSILTIPRSAQALSLTEPRRSPFVLKLLKALADTHAHESHGLNSKSPSANATVLSNILQCGNSFWMSGEPDKLVLIVSVIAAFVHRIPDAAFATDGDGSDEEETSVTKARTASKSGMTGAVGARTGEGVSDGEDVEMVDSVVVRNLLRSFSNFVSENTVRAIFTSAACDGRIATVRVCQLFNLLTRRKQSLRMPFQSALAFWRPLLSKHQRARLNSSAPGKAVRSRHILAILWDFCVDKNRSLDLQDDASAILLVFVRAYSHFLFVQNEDEMFKSRRPFSVDEVRELVQILKKVLFAALYLKTIPSGIQSSINASAAIVRAEPELLDEISGLMLRLYMCDSRHSFRDSEDFWIAGGGALTSDSFVQEAVKAGAAVFAEDSESSRSQLSYSGMSSRHIMSKATFNGAELLLRLAPYMAPFSPRAKIFHTWIAAEREKFGYNEFGGADGRWIRVRRNYLFEDAFDQLSHLGEHLKKHLRVKFIDEHGIEEAGIDGGGVYKEFMYELLRRAFSPSLYALFSETPDGHLYPNPAAHVVDEAYEERFAFVGRMLGKALFDGVLVDIPLASFFLSKLLQKFNYPSDLRSLDPELYRNIMFLRNCDPNMVGDLNLTFSVANSAFGLVDEVELVRGGRSVPVTAQNRIEYIHRVSNYRMNTQLQKQSDAFVGGFFGIVRPEYIRLFSERELQMLISGSTSAIDIQDLRRNTKYSGGYAEDVDVIEWFWKVVSELDVEEQSKLLQFVTSSPRAPLLGFAYLNPKFSVHRAEGDARLPTASTCMNLLKLPHYKDIETLRSKLKYSLNSNSGFDLS